MKTLTIVRHAKSSWNTNHEDHDRPLNTRGLDAAPKVGAEILQRGIVPDKIQGRISFNNVFGSKQYTD